MVRKSILCWDLDDVKVKSAKLDGVGTIIAAYLNSKLCSMPVLRSVTLPRMADGRTSGVNVLAL